MRGEPILVGRAEAAALLGVSRDTFLRHVAADLRVTYVGRRPMFLVADLRRWAEEHAAMPLQADLDRIRGGA